MVKFTLLQQPWIATATVAVEISQLSIENKISRPLRSLPT